MRQYGRRHGDGNFITLRNIVVYDDYAARERREARADIDVGLDEYEDGVELFESACGDPDCPYCSYDDPWWSME